MKESINNGVFVRTHGPFCRGFKYNGHRHWIDHYSYVHEGTELVVRYRMQKNDAVYKEEKYAGPCRFLVAAGLFHEIEIVSENGEWSCEFKVPEDSSPHISIYNRELLD